jgi:hypothetical protein
MARERFELSSLADITRLDRRPLRDQPRIIP